MVQCPTVTKTNVKEKKKKKERKSAKKDNKIKAKRHY